MTGFGRLEEQIKGQKDEALKQTVNYLLSREDMEQKYLNEEKNIDEMAKFIRQKGVKHLKNGWNYVPNEVVYTWAIMYFSLPNEFLKIEKGKPKDKGTNKINDSIDKNNIVSLKDAKKQIEMKQISLFGGVD